MFCSLGLSRSKTCNEQTHQNCHNWKVVQRGGLVWCADLSPDCCSAAEATLQVRSASSTPRPLSSYVMSFPFLSEATQLAQRLPSSKLVAGLMCQKGICKLSQTRGSKRPSNGHSFPAARKCQSQHWRAHNSSACSSPYFAKDLDIVPKGLYEHRHLFSRASTSHWAGSGKMEYAKARSMAFGISHGYFRIPSEKCALLSSVFRRA